MLAERTATLKHNFRGSRMFLFARLWSGRKRLAEPSRLLVATTSDGGTHDNSLNGSGLLANAFGLGANAGQQRQAKYFGRIPKERVISIVSKALSPERRQRCNR